MIRTLGVFFLLIPLLMMAQIPTNDRCDDAIALTFGQTLDQEYNQEATVTVEEQPDGYPTTCIKTFENDLWYSFITAADYAYYEVRINPSGCNSLAGLQAMIIQADSCFPDKYQYRDCANPFAEELIVMDLVESTPGIEMKVYIDGFDGTECGFEITLNAYKDNPTTPRKRRRSLYDYTRPTEFFEPVETETYFMNNEAHISWNVASQDNVDFFIIQRLVWVDVPDRMFGREIGRVNPQNTAGAERTITYDFRDIRRFQEGETYCYRVVKVDTEGNKSYTEPTCGMAELNEDFFISEVERTGEGQVYYIQFINNRKQDLIFSLLDENMQYIKGLTRPKEPKGADRITIDMEAYPSGFYHLKVEGKEEVYVRKFFKN
ncbi:MAG: hypothetical protein AAFQ83_19920 [Bacteroidota bacterium]